MPVNTARLIKAKVELFARDPDALGNNVKALKQTGLIRLRVGDWRIILDDGTVLLVLAVGPRGGIYED
ncbi:MAG: type II toxin-antitoxin system RelE/ParE family toxin [Rhodobacteraceae bacterium]|nr:type II toxin-antitoxin system RelE/ParE family toxin [Paracoccaceae bacterium]